MRRMAFAVVALVAGWAGPAHADTLPIIDNLPSTYTPGQAFTFQLSLPQLYEFTSYQLTLVFSTDVQNPALSVSGAAAASNYPFTSSSKFTSSSGTTPDGSGVTLTISDSIAEPGVTVTPGSNDQLATITVTPGTSLTGSITLSIDPNSIFHYNTENGTYDSPTDIPPIDQASGPGSGSGGGTSPVPAPAGAMLFGLGGLLVAARRHLGR